jgi:hypothetical protein
MVGRGQRKCKSFRRLFRPDSRNRRHQRYCSEELCRAASKAASQARWLSQPENRDYFRGKAAVDRVRASRSQHPGYWRQPRSGAPLQDVLKEQAIESTSKNSDSARPPLQEVLSAQPAVLIGLIAHIAGSPLQDEITVAAGRLLRLGNESVEACSLNLSVPNRSSCLSSEARDAGIRNGGLCFIAQSRSRPSLVAARSASNAAYMPWRPGTGRSRDGLAGAAAGAGKRFG